MRFAVRRAMAAGALVVLSLASACTSSSQRAVVASPHKVTVTTITLGRGTLSGLALDGTTLWACSETQGRGEHGMLLPLDPTTAQLSGPPVKVQSCAGLQIAALGYLWADDSRIDPVSERLAILPFAGQRFGCNLEAYLDGSLWASSLSGLVRIDPVTMRVKVVAFDEPMETFGRVVGMDGSVWFAFEDRVLRLDAATNKIVSTIPIGEHTNAMAAGAGSVWVANAGGGTVLRVDPATNRISARIRTGAENLLSIVVADGSAWAAGLKTVDGNTYERLWEIDPQTNRVVGHAVAILPPGHDGFPLVAAGGSLWVGDAMDFGSARLVRIGIAP